MTINVDNTRRQELLSYLPSGPLDSNLTFRILREANIRRIVGTEKFENCLHWSLSDWACAMVGEAGEVCDVIKKVNRGDFENQGWRNDLANEIADCLTYLDLLALAAGIDLGKALQHKFNVVSERVKSDIYIVNNGASVQDIADRRGLVD